MTNKDSEEGLLVKTGEGTLIYGTGIYDVAKTVLAGGSILLTTSTPSFATALTITNGATFSIAGTPPGVTLTALDVADGTLELDTDDIITVNGPVSFTKLTLNLSSLPDTDVSKSIIICDGELSEASQHALQWAYLENNIPDNTHASFTCTYDDQTEKTTISFTVKTDASPIGAANTTTWTGSGVWSSDGNWSASIPTALKKAAFTSDLAGKTVSIGSEAIAGAMTFGADGYTLAGTAPLEIAGEQGAAQIEVTAGSHTINVPLLFNAVVALPLQTGTSLAVKKPITDGELKKTGAGALILEENNTFIGGVSFEGGLSRIASDGALNGASRVTLGGGTLEFTEGTPHLTAPVAVDITETTAPTILKTDVDTTFDSLDVTGGVLKRGAGKLIIDASAAGKQLTLTTVRTPGETGMPASSAQFSFPADGSTPGGGYGGFTIAEGEVVIKGDPSTPDVLLKGTGIIGMNTPDGTVQPSLTIDGAFVDNSMTIPGGATHFFVGYRAGIAGGLQTEPTLRILNGGTLKANTIQIERDCHVLECHPTVAVTNGTLWGTYALHLTRAVGGKSVTRIRAKDAKILTTLTTFYMQGALDMEVANTFLGKSDLVTPMPLRIDPWNVHQPTGQVVFCEGSIAAISEFQNFNFLTKAFRVVFDDSEWVYGSSDYTFPASSVSPITSHLKCEERASSSPRPQTQFSPQRCRSQARVAS